MSYACCYEMPDADWSRLHFIDAGGGPRTGHEAVVIVLDPGFDLDNLAPQVGGVEVG